MQIKPGEYDKEIERLIKWREDSLSWTRAYFGDNIVNKARSKGIQVQTATGLSLQQEQAYKELDKLIKAKVKKLQQTMNPDAGIVLTKQEEIYSKKKGISIMSGRGCHARDTDILMYDGTVKKVQNVKVGDRLMGDDSTPRNVLSLARGREKMYRIQYYNGTYYDINESHILSLKAGSDYPNTKSITIKKGSIVNVTVKEYLSWPQKKKNVLKGYKSTGIEFSNKCELEIPSYILGLWLGDGCKSTSGITNIDEEIIEELQKYCDDSGYRLSHHKNKKDHHIRSSGTFEFLLKKYNLFNNKHIPFEYKTSSRKERLDLLAGLIDTDGHLDYRGFQIEIIQKSERLTKDILFLCQSLGLHASLGKKEVVWYWNGIEKTGHYFRISITRGIECIPTKIKRKRPIEKDNNKNHYTTFGFKVIPLEVDNYYGFELDKNHLYLLGDFTVTHNTGKDFWVAHAAHRLLNTLLDCHIVVTANTETQLKNVFWTEFKDIAYLARKASSDPDEHETVITKMFDIQSEKVSYKDPAHPKWFMEAIVSRNQSSNESVQHAAISGRHEKYLIIIVDEGSHIKDEVFKDFEETMTGAVNFMIVIYNPKRNSGYAKRTQYEDKDQWITLRWNAEESEIVVNKQLHKDMENKYGGKNSNPYRISVLGLPPLTDTDTLFPADWIEDAKVREIAWTENDPLIKGFDVGGGGDPSVIGSRRGGNVKDFGFAINKESDSNKVVQWARANFLTEEADGMVGDVGGLGWHIIGALQKDLGWRMVSYDSRNKAIRDDLYVNKRTEDIYGLRDRFQNKTISIPDDEELTNELLAIKADHTKAKRAIIGKKELRKVLGGESTNKTDVLAQMFSVDDNDFRKTPASYEDEDDDCECVGAPIRNKMTGY